MTIRPVRPNTPLEFRADEWNQLAALVNTQPPTPGSRAAAALLDRCVWLWGRNDSGADVSPGAVVGITGVVYTYADRADEFLYRPALKFAAQASTTPPDKAAVTLDPIKAGAFGRVAVAGIVAAQVTINHADHPLAAAATSGAVFTSGYQGVARILYAAGTSGTQWAVVRLQAHTSYRLRGTTDGAITAGSYGTVTLAHNSESMANVYLDWLHGGENISTGQKVFVAYFAQDAKWRIDGADCEA